jgi:hypothetical protein
MQVTGCVLLYDKGELLGAARMHVPLGSGVRRKSRFA